MNCIPNFLALKIFWGRSGAAAQRRSGAAKGSLRRALPRMNQGSILPFNHS